MENLSAFVVYTTFGDMETASKLCGRLVEARLAACVNIFPGMTAIYEWQGALQNETEVAVLLKTVGAQKEALVTALRRLHPYETPAILVFEATQTDADYLDWLKRQTVPMQ